MMDHLQKLTHDVNQYWNEYMRKRKNGDGL
jgi:hypothetical protein